jgi:hypothetical protein
MRRFTTRFVLLLSALLLSLPALAQQDVVTTLMGGGPNDIPAVDANLYNPTTVAADTSGNYYIAAYNQNRIFKVNTTGTLTVFAGAGYPGYSGDGVVGGAASAALNHPYGVAIDSSGNVYIADTNNCVVRKVDTANTITTIAGIAGACTFGGDGGKGTSANLYFPGGVATDTKGNLFIADTYNCRIRKLVLSTDTITTYAGNGTCAFMGDGSAATSAEVNYPYGVATDTTGNLFIGDTSNCAIREVTLSTLKISSVAGNHTCGFMGDGASATLAEIYYVYQLAVSGTTVTIGDSNNDRVRQFTIGGTINTVAGSATAGFCGDGAKATSACLSDPTGIAINGSNIYVADQSNERVRLFTVGGNISTVAGNGSYNTPTLMSGVVPNGVVLNYPFGVYEDPSGNVFINDSNNNLVRELVKTTDVVNLYAGTGTSGYSGDGGLATKAELTTNYGVARDSSGNIYIADTFNCIVREVSATTGDISTFAGVPNRCSFSGDGGKATSANLYYPGGVFVDSKNNVYIADTYNQAIREVSSGTINTIAGIGGHAGYSGDGGLAVAAELNYPYGVTVDGAGNVYIADSSNCRIREVTALTGFINTVAGNGACAFTGDGIAMDVSLNQPQGVRVDANGNLFIADTFNSRLRWVNTAGLMTTFGGNGTAGYNGDGGLATSAEFYYPSGISEDASGNFQVADRYNFFIRSISAFAALNTSSGNVNFPLTSVGSTSAPQIVTLSAVGPLTINNISVTGAFSESDDCPTSLANATICTMYVYFVPTASGSAAGSVTINTNGFFNAVSTISLTGLGTAISVTGAPLNFGNQLVKTTSTAQTVTVKNTGTTSITMNGITLSETTDFAISANTCPATGSKLSAGASCTISVTFTPESTGLKKGSVVINDTDPTSPQLAGFSGTGTSNVTLSPTTVTFATTAVGLTSSTTKITLTNNTGVSITLKDPAVTVTGPFASASSTTCTNNLVLAKLATCFVNAEFKPTLVGFASGTVSIADTDVTSPQTAALQGIGTGIKFSTTSINFGTVTRGNTVSSTVTIYNVGTTTVTLIAGEISGTNSADFGNTSGNPPCNGTLAAGANCTFSLTFDPSIVGSETATYKVFDNSPGSPQTISLKGTGQ